MGKKIFDFSKDGRSEYCINVVRIGKLKPIEGSDFLAQTFVGDASVVVRKDQVTEGDLMYYASNECQLCEEFLSANNLFEIGCYEKNSNHEMVGEILKSADELRKKFNDTGDAQYLNSADELYSKAKSMCGFFSHNGRVRMIRLKKTPSMGYLFTTSEMAAYNKKTDGVNLEDYIGVDIDTVDGKLFVKAYVPPIKENTHTGKGKMNKRNNRLKRFDRMIPGEFSFHYDTSMLAKNMWRINPNDSVVISVKLHGTSGIFSNTKIKTPVKIPLYKKIWNMFVDYTGFLMDTRFIDYVVEYGNIYSSRSVIKNQFINKGVTDGYYKFDVWNEANEVMKPYIDKGMTVYAEICGWAGKTMIQKGYDYGCKEGEFFVMPYRITTPMDDGKKYEWNVDEVRQWTERIIREHPEISGKVRPITILYHGTLSELYPDVSTSEHWHENVLHMMMCDKKKFGMEELEPLCKNKCYREGIVLRIDNDDVAEAFKLKTEAFREREAKAMDRGEVDIEMQDAYCSNES